MGVHMRTNVAEAVASRPATFDFDETFRAEYERVACVIARVIRDPARSEDLAVETFCKLLRTPGAQGERVGGWLYRTAVRAALDELRRRARRARYERAVSFLKRQPRTPDELFFAAEEQGRVRTILAALPGRQAELLILRSDGLSYDELATALSIDPASIGTLLARARAAFRKEYVKRYGE
jgi:RNA polymerase sigma-70 factor (ECF subfamily)